MKAEILRDRKREKEIDKERERENSKTAYILKGQTGTKEHFFPSSM